MEQLLLPHQLRQLQGILPMHLPINNHDCKQELWLMLPWKGIHTGKPFPVTYANCGNCASGNNYSSEQPPLSAFVEKKSGMCDSLSSSGSDNTAVEVPECGNLDGVDSCKCSQGGTPLNYCQLHPLTLLLHSFKVGYVE